MAGWRCATSSAAAQCRIYARAADWRSGVIVTFDELVCDCAGASAVSGRGLRGSIVSRPIPVTLTEQPSSTFASTSSDFKASTNSCSSDLPRRHRLLRRERRIWCEQARQAARGNSRRRHRYRPRWHDARDAVTGATAMRLPDRLPRRTRRTGDIPAGIPSAKPVRDAWMAPKASI